MALAKEAVGHPEVGLPVVVAGHLVAVAAFPVVAEVLVAVEVVEAGRKDNILNHEMLFREFI